MISDIKQELLNNPDKIRELLEIYDFHNISIKHNYISFGRSEDSRKDAIAIFLKDNSYLNVKDFSRNEHGDIFSYIARTKGTNFADVLFTAKNVLGITETSFHKRREVFGGFYSGINKIQTEVEQNLIDESFLNRFDTIPNLRFIQDRISISTQAKYKIGYSWLDNAITIPMRDCEGRLIGIKGRKNYECDEDKYFYIKPCRCSYNLFGYSENYSEMYESDVIILESEKSVMQLDSYEIYNSVALGSGSISEIQVKLIYELNPKRIILMHDVGYKKELVNSNLRKLAKYSRLKNTEILYWNNFDKNYPDKISPTDLGKEFFLKSFSMEIENYISED